jgi:hypothetical protein
MGARAKSAYSKSSGDRMTTHEEPTALGKLARELQISPLPAKPTSKAI